MFLYVSGCNQDIVFVVDSSGSIINEAPESDKLQDWNLVLDFISSIVDLLSIGTTGSQVGMVRYGNLGSNYFFMNDYQEKEELLRAIGKTRL